MKYTLAMLIRLMNCHNLIVIQISILVTEHGKHCSMVIMSINLAA
jgi:hypothetical protein